jgi:D-alanine-D-alanine ligase-like ATP-grasp enzyme
VHLHGFRGSVYTLTFMPQKKRSKRESLILGKILARIAPKIGARVLIEPEWHIAGQITFKSGKRSYFRYNTLDLNPVGASDIAKDKDYAHFFMQKMGYAVVPGSKTFFRKDWAEAIGAPRRNIDAAYTHAQKIGFPVVVKPNSGSQGKDVAFAHNKREFYRAARAVFKNDRIMIVQKPVTGTDYRLVVLDTDVISAYARTPLTVIGDGRSTIATLMTRLDKQFQKEKRDTGIPRKDPRMLEKLKRLGLSFNSVPKKDERIPLLDNANLSTGGTSVDVTNRVHPAFKKLAVRLTKDMGLRLCGVDLMVDGDISEKPGKCWILEINAAPGLDHYARSGKAQEKIVEDLYTRVLRSLERN